MKWIACLTVGIWLGVSGCATAIIPAKVKYVAWYEVVSPNQPSEGQGAVASLHTRLLKLHLPGLLDPKVGGFAPQICFKMVEGQSKATSPNVIYWMSIKSCGGTNEFDEKEHAVTAKMGGTKPEEFADLTVMFPSGRPDIPLHGLGGKRLEMTMDIGPKELQTMYVFLYPRFEADLWALIAD